jgi:hypothetical protein
VAEGFDVVDSYETFAGDSLNGSSDNVMKHAHSDTRLNELRSEKPEGKRQGIRWTASLASLIDDRPHKAWISPSRDPKKFELDKCARCEDIEAVDVVMGDWKLWRPIVGAWEQFAAVFAGEFLHGSEKIAYVTHEKSMTQALVYRNERLRQVNAYKFLLLSQLCFPQTPQARLTHAGSGSIPRHHGNTGPFDQPQCGSEL